MRTTPPGWPWAGPPTLELRLRHGIVDENRTCRIRLSRTDERHALCPFRRLSPDGIARTEPSDSSHCVVGAWVWGRCASRPSVRKHLRDPGQRFPYRHGGPHSADLWGRHRRGPERRRGRRLPVADPWPHADINGTKDRSRPDTVGYKGVRAEGSSCVAGGRIPRSQRTTRIALKQRSTDTRGWAPRQANHDVSDTGSP
jgi:hypothetical protein